MSWYLVLQPSNALAGRRIPAWQYNSRYLLEASKKFRYRLLLRLLEKYRRSVKKENAAFLNLLNKKKKNPSLFVQKALIL